jgi:hypothetical protein
VKISTNVSTLSSKSQSPVHMATTELSSLDSYRQSDKVRNAVGKIDLSSIPEQQDNQICKPSLSNSYLGSSLDSYRKSEILPLTMMKGDLTPFTSHLNQAPIRSPTTSSPTTNYLRDLMDTARRRPSSCTSITEDPGHDPQLSGMGRVAEEVPTPYPNIYCLPISKT